MKVLLLTTEAFGGVGGIAQYNRDLVVALSENSEVTRIDVIARKVSRPIEQVRSKVEILNRDSLGKIKFIFKCLKSAPTNYDVIICGHINLLSIGLILKIICNSPIILLAYGIEVWSSKSINKIFLKHINSVWVISSFTKKRMNLWAGLPDDAYQLLPNAIDLKDYGVREKRKDLVSRYGLNNKKVMLTLGRIISSERYKGHDELLELMPELIKVHPDLIYLVAGSGDDQARLRKKASMLGLDGFVVFTGYVNEKEKADIIRLADVFAMPSSGEGFGFVFLEALACGIPVVGSATDGSKEALLDGVLGELVVPAERESLKNAILKIINQKKAIPKELDYFSFENFSLRVNKSLATLRNIV